MQKKILTFKVLRGDNDYFVDIDFLPTCWNSFILQFFQCFVLQLLYAGRAEAPTTAVGASKLHRVEVDHVLREPLYNIK